MKCEVCREFLEEYLDGELAPQDLDHVDAHLIACVECSESFAALTAEQKIFARYDREIEVPPFLWTRVAAHTVSESNTAKRGWFASLLGKPSVAGAIVVLLIALAIGVAYLLSDQKAPEMKVATAPSTTPTPDPVRKSVESAVPKREEAVASNKKSPRRQKPIVTQTTVDQFDVLSSDLAYLDIDEQDTAL